jgi:Cu(I)/Ag(I) efflux system membrane protein CusA/SilA
MINLIFEDNVDLYFARTRVLEKLNLSSGILPEGVTPVLGPDATGVGQVYWYTVEGPYDPGTLHSLQHWFIRYQLNSVQVAEVGAIGGFLREYQVDVDQGETTPYNVPRMVFESIQRSNTNVGAGLEVNDTEMAVRGIGLIGSILLRTLCSPPVAAPYLEMWPRYLGPDFRRGSRSER